MMQDDTMPGTPWDEAGTEADEVDEVDETYAIYDEEDTRDTGVSRSRWLAAEQTSWLQSGSHRVPRPVSVPLVRPKRFRGLPPGVNVLLLALLVLAIVLAIVLAMQIGHTVHTLTSPVPSVLPTHTVHPTRSATPHH